MAWTRTQLIWWLQKKRKERRKKISDTLALNPDGSKMKNPDGSSTVNPS